VITSTLKNCVSWYGAEGGGEEGKVSASKKNLQANLE